MRAGQELGSIIEALLHIMLNGDSVVELFEGLLVGGLCEEERIPTGRREPGGWSWQRSSASRGAGGCFLNSLKLRDGRLPFHTSVSNSPSVTSTTPPATSSWTNPTSLSSTSRLDLAL